MVSLIGFILTLSIVVLVHEWGHYIVARLSGIHVQAFSFGFGTVLYKYVDKRGCEWRLSAFPLGGYVKFLENAEVKENPSKFKAIERSSIFEFSSVYRRLLVVLAGPVMNLVLAVLIYTGIALQGIDVPSNRIDVFEGSPAAMMGLESGNRVLRLNDTPIVTLSDLKDAFDNADKDQKISLLVQNDTLQELWISFTLDKGAEPFKALGITPFCRAIQVAGVQEKSPADLAGIRAGDTILEVAGNPERSAYKMIAAIRDNGAKPLIIKVKHSTGETVTLTMTPKLNRLENGAEVYQIGANLLTVADSTRVKYGLFKSLGIGLSNVYAIVDISLKGIGRLVVGEESTKSLMGPLMIGSLAGQTLQLGFLQFIGFIAIISISIGMINLFPLPVLDGGHVIFFLYEIVTGKKPNEKIMRVLTSIGVSLLILLMVFTVSNDLLTIFGVH